MKFTWSILDLSAENNLITHAKYRCTISDDGQSVATEGNWWFNEPKLKVPFEQVTGAHWFPTVQTG